MYRETKFRSVLKAVSWRVSGTLATGVLVYIFTRKLFISLSIAGIESVLKIIIYFFHERLWDRIKLGKHEIKPAVIWFTGLSGAGKSTVADLVYRKLVDSGLKVERLDGDNVRNIFPNTGFTRDARNEHVKRVGYLAGKLEKNGIFVVASFVSPYRESRDFVRNLCQNFLEVYLSTPLEICEERDPKGLYAKARKGEIKNFTGIDDPYEPPLDADLAINTGDMSAEEAVLLVMKKLNRAIHGRGTVKSKNKKRDSDMLPDFARRFEGG